MKSYLLLTVAALSVAALAGSPNGVYAKTTKAHAQSATGKLIAYWKFDEGAGRTARDSAGKNEAALSSGVAWAPGIINGAVHLDGGPNAYVTVPAGIVSTLSDFTISTWVKVDINAGWNRVFDFGTGTNAYMFLSPDSGSNTVRYAITTTSHPGEQTIDSSAPLTVGIWHFVAVTLSGSTGTLYIDGMEVGQNTNMSLRPLDLGRTTLDYIGKSQWQPDPTLLGSVDDFRIYSRALSPPEINGLAHLAGN